MYNRLFTKIVDSSIWLENLPTRVVWITFLACMDEDGMVTFACPANVARRAGVSQKDTDAALHCLESPDPNSFDPDNEGRRIQRVPGGWIVLNAKKYRDIFTREIQREQTRIRVARHRAKGHVTECNADVTEGNDLVTQSDAPAEADAKAESKRDMAISVLRHLNEKAGKSYREVDSNLNTIMVRMGEKGVTKEGCFQMIDRQAQMWKGGEMEEYLRPETLFRASKFGGYYDNREQAIKNNGNQKQNEAAATHKQRNSKHGW